MLQEVERVAGAYPGATIRPKLLIATWELGEGTVESFSVSGCHNYGKAASRTTRSTERLSVDEVIKVALELAEKFMDAGDFDLFSKAVEGNFKFVGESDGIEYVLVEHPFGEIALTHSFDDSTDTIVISWPAL